VARGDAFDHLFEVFLVEDSALGTWDFRLYLARGGLLWTGLHLLLHRERPWVSSETLVWQTRCLNMLYYQRVFHLKPIYSYFYTVPESDLYHLSTDPRVEINYAPWR
jgi:hypothetical protein